LRGNYVARVVVTNSRSDDEKRTKRQRPASCGWCSFVLSPVRKGGAKVRSGELGWRVSACASAQNRTDYNELGGKRWKRAVKAK